MSEPLSATVAKPSAMHSRGRGIKRLADAALLDGLCLALRNAGKGRIRLALPSGRSAVIGRGGGAEATLRLVGYGLVWKVLRRGLIGFADAYVSGDIETEDLGALLRFLLENEAAFSSSLPGVMRCSGGDIRFHSARRNTRIGSRRNIAAHYDLGNEFYALWLDKDLSYSSGIFSSPEMSLELAQAAKHAMIIEALELQPGHEVLEIGCGWGSLAAEIAGKGANVTAITISEQQFLAARQRLARSPDAGRSNVRLEDYRDTRGVFDRIASVEMIEAVGADNWRTYFRTIRERLKAGGSAVVQAITIREDLFEHYRLNPDFIQRYIFPGGMLPSVPAMRIHAKEAGLDLVELERFGASYALTLAEWRRRFIVAWPRIEALGFDERFRRMWLYYLTYCEVGFQHGTIDVGLYRLRAS